MIYFEIPAYYVGTNERSFRAGEAAKILGVVTYAPSGSDPRVCFRVQYADGRHDFCPVSDDANYQLLTEDDVALRHVPIAPVQIK